MMQTKFLFILLISICVTFFAHGQEVWPVQVTGSMSPPHSLDLKVYTIDRVNDLKFNVLLTDPKEESLKVTPVLSIEQNGNIIYQTDMNYVLPALELLQNDIFVMDGSVLSPYLSNEALTGKNAEGWGSVILPEGFLNICVQMYGVDRVVPVSNKFCIAANFRLNQAPQIIRPAFNEKIKMPPIQNMIFSWMPMHIGSGNNPGAVEYLFELVELPQGVMNANDAFESALKVYSTTTTTTSLIYSPAEPVLEPNKYYAWRITASSVLYPTSKLFQNDGRSEISVFVMYDGDAPVTEMNPFDNPAPRACSVYETSYGAVIKADNESVIVGANQEVKLGYFKLKVKEASGSTQDGYSGTGFVYYPMFRSTLEVEFTQIKVNQEGRVYASEGIEAVLDPDIKLPLDKINSTNAKEIISTSYVKKLYDKYNDQRDVSKLSEQNQKLNQLPVFLKNEKYVDDDVCVSAIYFNPKSAFLNLVSQNKNGDIFAATSISATPYGMKSNSYLVPIYISPNRSASEKITESIELAGFQSAGSKIECDCKGYQNVKAKTGIIISPKILHQYQSTAAISLITDKAIQNNNTYIGKVSLSQEFEITGMEGFKFIPKSGRMDLDQNTTLTGQTNSAMNNPEWRGVVIDDVVLELPQKYNMINQAKPLLLDKGQLIINDKDIQEGFFYQINVLSFSKGRMGPWAYSIDSILMNIKENKQSNLSLRGQLMTPFFDDAFPYSANYQESKSGKTKLIASVLQPELKMSMWHGHFTSKSDSKIEASLIDNNAELVLSPKCSFNGNIKIDFTDKQFRDAILNQNKGITIDELKNALKVETLAFELSNLKIEGLSSDPFKEAGKRYNIIKFDKNNTKLLIGKEENKCSDVSFQYDVKDNNERLGLKLIVVKGQSKIELIIWSKSKGSVLEFEGVEVKTIELKCNCTAMNIIPSEDEWNKLINNYYYNKIISGKPLQSHTGGLMHFIADSNSSIYNLVEIINIKENSISWFPAAADASVIYIPFLDKYLNIEKDGAFYKGKYNPPMFGKPSIPWVYKIFDNLENSVKDTLDLPIVISEDNWSQFGFKGAYTLPENYKLFISEFKSAADKLESATIRINLIGMIEVEGKTKFVEFSSLKDLPIGPDKVSLKDVLLHLINDFKVNDNISFLSSIKAGLPDT
ncbi:MAG: hypothetical protein M3Q56_08875, partial [Bacteroidota bacterium]|nr:hypothetical protein [Bacteroidota bacterium]